MMTKDLPWRNAHRIRLHYWANNRSKEDVEFAIPDLGQPAKSSLFSRKKKKPKKVKDQAPEKIETPQTGEKDQIQVGPALHTKDEKVSRKTANNFFLDARLAGAPIQCSMEDGTCLDMK